MTRRFKLFLAALLVSANATCGFVHDGKLWHCTVQEDSRTGQPVSVTCDTADVW